MVLPVCSQERNFPIRSLDDGSENATDSTLSPSYGCANRHVGQQVWSWGNGSYGCLGLGGDENRWYPDRIPLFAESEPATVVEISAGKWHAICLTQTNQVYSWGRNNWGQASKD